MSARRLFVLRHAAAAWPAPAEGDYARRLDSVGLQEAESLARFLAERKIVFEAAVSSGAARTRDTLASLGNERVTGETLFDDSLYNGGIDAYRAAAERIVHARSLLLVGHNPGIGNFVRESASAGEPDALRRLALGFPTCALAILRVEEGVPTFLEEMVLPLEDAPASFRSDDTAPISGPRHI